MLVAITGSNGFIGSACCKYLKSKSLNIRKIQRIKELDSFHIENISPESDWNKALKNVDIVIHCAGLAHETKKLKTSSFQRYHEQNALSTHNLALQASRNNVKKFIYLSSIKVNGESTPIDKPFRDPFFCRPCDEYSFSKLNAENYLRDLSSKTNLETTIIRPPLVYGEGVKANFNTLLKLIYYKVPLPFAIIKNLRSFLYLDNLCDFIYRILIEEKLYSSNTFLLSDDKPISTSELIKLISMGFGIDPNLLPIPASFLDFSSKIIGKKRKLSKLTNSLIIDSSPTYKFLNWEPPYSIEEGITKTAIWFKNQQE